MNFRIIRAAACAAAFACLPPVVSRSDPAGFAFLEVPAGARGSALGGAYASRAEGAEAVFWNPAGLAATDGIQVTASHYEFLQNLRHAQFAVAGKLLGGGTAVAVRAMYSEPIVERDAIGNEIGTFGAHDLEFSVAHGRQIRDRLRAGGSAQLVRERLGDFSATTYSFGLGATWDPAPRLRLGLAVDHLGPAAHYDLDGTRGEPVPLPTAVQVGGSYGAAAGGFDLHGTLEGRWTRGRAGIGMVGAEVAHPSGAAIRVGMRLNDETTGFSIGAGYAVSKLKLDYAFVPFRLDLGDTQRFTVSAQF
jgi:hypothetical protein